MCNTCVILGFSKKINLFKYKKFKDGRCRYKNTGSSHLTSHANYNLRNADVRQECFNTTKYGKHSLRHFRLLLWSKIQRELSLAPIRSNFKKGIRKTDIASLIDDSCNDCVLCKSQHYLASPFYSCFRVTQFTIQRYQVVIYQNYRIQSLNHSQNFQYITSFIYMIQSPQLVRHCA